jgi:hypothetical protein
MADYLVEAQKKNIYITQNDTSPLSYSVALNGVAHDMTGMQLDMTVINYAGVVIKSWSSAGGTPAITISTTTFSIAVDAFTDIGVYKYDLQLTDGSDIMTIMKGRILVTNEETT